MQPGRFKTNLLLQADRDQAGFALPRKVLVSRLGLFAFLFSFKVMLACFLASLPLWRSLVMAFLVSNNSEVCAGSVTRRALMLECYPEYRCRMVPYQIYISVSNSTRR